MCIRKQLVLPFNFPLANSTKSASFKDKIASALRAPLPRTTVPSFLQSTVNTSSLPSLFLITNWNTLFTYRHHILLL